MINIQSHYSNKLTSERKSPLGDLGVLWGIFFLLLTLTSCGIYSFSGATTGDAKTVSIELFKNEAAIRNPSLSSTLTEKLKDRFLRETRLSLVSKDGDMTFSGTITNYATAPSAITGGDQASQTRLTITVNMKFVNKTDKTKNFEQSFSQYADFPASKTLTIVENQLIEDIGTKLTQDIFSKATNNW
ncbi:MAG: LptE family protein [Bacteroidetes bacterium]|nr:LptE family protein [Bacteroidota bacterium]